ncbi:ArsR/SmtB family transcription factor [Devosia sp.]|uniref:ArsR/SmtB family transcription factor n=1 Tax=Devosia sp. TaxID=1871048 RepID=UPI002EF144F4
MNETTTMQDEEIASALRALGHPVRLSILRILATQLPGDCCCTDVTQCLPLAQSTVSQHIKVLLEAGLVERHARGTRNCYTVRHDRLEALGDAVGGLITGLAAPVAGRGAPALTEPA